MKLRNRSFIGFCACASAMLARPHAAIGQIVTGTSGEWVFSSDESVAEASVTNADGAVFGIVCAGNCHNYLASDRPCREAAAYSGTMRSTIGEFPVEMTCRHVEGRFVLTMNTSEDFIRIAAECAELGVSVRLDESDSQLYRFSLRGAYQAIYLTLASAMLNSEPESEDGETPG